MLCLSLFTFYLDVSLFLKCVSCRLHKIASCFLIHSDNLCLLIGTFKPLTVKVIIDIIGLIVTISVADLHMLLLFFVPTFISYSFFCLLWLIEHYLFTFLSFFSILVILFLLFLVIALEFTIYIYNKFTSTYK